MFVATMAGLVGHSRTNPYFMDQLSNVFPAIALGLESGSSIMNHPPRGKTPNYLSKMVCCQKYLLPGFLRGGIIIYSGMRLHIK